MIGIEHLIRMEPMQIKLIGLSIFIVRQRGAKLLMQGLPPQEEETIQIKNHFEYLSKLESSGKLRTIIWQWNFLISVGDWFESQLGNGDHWPIIA